MARKSAIKGGPRSLVAQESERVQVGVCQALEGTCQWGAGGRWKGGNEGGPTPEERAQDH